MESSNQNSGKSLANLHQYGIGPAGQAESSEWGIETPNSELRTLNSLGMTLVEVVLVFAIVGILSAIVIPKLDISLSSGGGVEGVAEMIASDIRYAQGFAMANRVSKSVIFVAGSSSYSFNPASGLDPSPRLPSGVTLAGNFTVTFNSLGEPIAGGGGSVSVTRWGRTKTIDVVSYTGKVNIP
jgi:hypothetical protein